MKWIVTLNDVEFAVQSSVECEDVTVEVEGAQCEVEVLEHAGGRLVALVNHIPIAVDLTVPNAQVLIRGRTWPCRIKVETERSHQLAIVSRASGGRAHHRNVVALMPGKIVDVCVQPGDSVQLGGVLLIQSAMKMENEIRLDREGTVKTVHVTPGQAVEAGALLVEVE